MKAPMILVAVALIAASALAQEEEEIELMAGCSWKDVELDFPAEPRGRLSFRYQDCGSATGFSLDEDGVLTQTWNKFSDEVARFWPLDGKKPSARIEEIAGSALGPEERSRCVVHLNMITGNYSYTPDARYLEELLARDEPFGACGEFGDSNDSIQYWTAIDGKLIAYLRLGQDTPLFDPKSFRYRAK